MENNNEYYEDEIDVFELIHLLLKNKKTIFLGTLIITVITFLITAFIIKPIYQDHIEFRISNYPTIGTKYGDYPSPVKTNEDVVKIIQFTDSSDNNELLLALIQKGQAYDGSLDSENISERIILTQEKSTPNIFSVGIKDTNVEFIKEFGNIVTDEYVEYIDYKIEKEYLIYFKSMFESNIRASQMDLELKTKLLFNAEKLSDETNKFIEGTSEVNPNWVKTEGYIMETRKDIEDLKVNIEMNTNKLLMIEEDKEKLTYPRTGSTFKSNLLERQDETIKSQKTKFMSKEINGPEQVSPNIKLNTAVGLILGMMLSIFYVFAREWWKNNKTDMKARWNRYK